jgi:PIN domain nuclease of toxin-antitoxin system
LKYVLDTHALLWMRSNDPRLSRKKWEPIFSSIEHHCYFSTVSLWEMSIKRTIGKLTFPGTIVDFSRTLIEGFGFEQIPIETVHLQKLETLSLHHQDPFDRLLIAQAMELGATCVTRDRVWSEYPVPTEW